MFFSSRISTKELARLCRRLATSLEAGIDVRTVWAREAQRATGLIRRARYRAISDAVHDGQSLYEALSQTDDYFPEMFLELARVGDETGHQAEGFAHLAEHYEERLRLRRMLVTASVWPMIELTAAVVVVGLLILIQGLIAKDVDLLGFGLKGGSGLFVYVTVLALIAAGLFVVFQALRRGLMWTRPIQAILFRLPLIGRALESVALSRLAWALHLTLDSGMELRRALRMSIRSTHGARYTAHLRSVEAAAQAGTPICEAFEETGVFPDHFLDAARVGEESGKLVESLALLSRQYREQAEAAFKTLTVIAGFAIWLLVAAIIIMMIFRLASYYLGYLTSV